MHCTPAQDEHTYPLSAAMLEALHDAYVSSPSPFNVANVKTAIALLNRGFIRKHSLGEQLHTQMLYELSPAGATAYRISARLAGIELPAQIGA